MTKIRSFSNILGLDVATSAAVMSRGWTLLSGPITLLMIIHALSPEEQGYIGIFESLIALRIFVELGLTTVFMQFVTHERGQLTISRMEGLSGPTPERQKIASLLKIATKWYAAMGVLLFIILIVGGSYYFSKNSTGANDIHWQRPLLLLSFNTALSLVMQPFLGVLEGMGKIGEYFVVGLVNAIFTSLALWAALSFGLGLLAMPISAFAGIIATVVCLLRWRRAFLDLLKTTVPTEAGVRWKEEVLPLQLKTAVTAVLGYFIFNLTIPIVFAMLGSVAAGQLGQTFRLTAMVLGLANAWILTRSATYGRLISQNAYSDLSNLFRKSLAAALAVSAVGCVGLGILLWSADRIDSVVNIANLGLIGTVVKTVAAVPERLASPSVMIALGLNTLLSAFVYALQSLVRAHRKEPFIPNAIVAAITVPFITYFGARYYGLEGIAWGYFLRTLIIETPLTLWIFHRTSSIGLSRILTFMPARRASFLHNN